MQAYYVTILAVQVNDILTCTPPINMISLNDTNTYKFDETARMIAIS